MEECIRQRRILAEEFRESRKIFLALGDETRQHIFLSILENEAIGMRVPEITVKTHLSRPAVSHHLRILKESGIVRMYRKGTRNYYYADVSRSGWSHLKKLADLADTIIRKAAEAGYPHIEDE